MQILIDNYSGVSIYEQIHAQIRDQIVSGELQADQPLPSIRSLAKDLRISVITTKRAYEELEKEGFIYTMAGKGSYVSARNKELLKENHLRSIEEHMEEIRKLAVSCGLDKEDVLEMWHTIWEESE